MFVDKLIELDYVKRIYNESDRRIILIELTDRGLNYLDRLLTDMKLYFKKRIKNYDDKDLLLLKETLDDVYYFIEKQQN